MQRCGLPIGEEDGQGGGKRGDPGVVPLAPGGQKFLALKFIPQVKVRLL